MLVGEILIKANFARKISDKANNKLDPLEVLGGLIRESSEQGLYSCTYDEREREKLYGNSEDIVNLLNKQGYIVDVDNYFTKGKYTHGFDAFLNVYHIEW